MCAKVHIAVVAGLDEKGVSMYLITQSPQYKKVISIIIAILICSGCSTVESVDLSSRQVQEQIASGEILQQGDHGNIFTADVQKHSGRSPVYLTPLALFAEARVKRSGERNKTHWG